MTQRTIDLSSAEFLHKANEFLTTFEKNADTTEEFQRLVLNALVVAGLAGSTEFSSRDPDSLTRHLSDRVGVGAGTLRRYAAGVSAPARFLRRDIIRSVLDWFEEQRKKEEERKAEKQRFWAEVAAAEKNAAPTNWVTVGDPKADDASSVAFMMPCPRLKWFGGIAMPMGFRCDDTETRHGHLALACEDGTGIVPAKVESKAFLREICDLGRGRGWVTEKEKETILALPEAQGLLEDLTEREKKVLADPELLKNALSFGFIGL